MSNYFDKNGNYINCENLSLAEIYHRAFALGVESTPVEDKRPKGEWEEIQTNPPEFLGHRFYICSKCGREIDVITPDESLDDYPYCHCGACMIKEKEND